MSKTPLRLRVSRRDLDILTFLRTERGATAEVLHRRFFPSNKRDALKSTIRRLSGDKNSPPLVASRPLDDRRVYYQVTPDGAGLIGKRSDAPDPLGPSAKTRIYAESWYLYVQRPGKRTRLLLTDLREEFQLVDQRLPKHAFYLDESRREPRLGVILVDHKASVQHTVTKTVDAIARILHRGVFPQFIRQGRFVVTVLTATRGAKDEIDVSLQPAIIDRLAGELLRIVGSAPDEFPVKFDISVVPGLLDLLTGQPKPGSQGE